ncbi:ATPase [Brachybacterium phenoliresistens]|uniref:ATPase n=1 Tax=Brachybacterium phenoliresistens TaxID=396014 RepID=Z9JU82_9MICO|nr:ATPase [Brachybacterium phenoliresistens]
MSADPLRPGQMRLSHVQLHNWGTFHGGHDLPVPRGGLLLTGESGSGKSSILDALSAVLMRPGETRFNAAAQDGPAGDRDRTPMSYVRGAYRKQADDDTGEVTSGYLRPATTVSGIALTFEDGRDRTVTAVRVLHVSGRSAAAADLRTAFVLFDRPIELADVLAPCRSGIDRRRLKRTLSPLLAEESYTKFGVQLRRLTGIGSEGAQKLLHRTQSAKSLTSLDELLRDFMLEEPETFSLAQQAVEQFQALQDAHATVLDARTQVDVLLPQREHWQVHRRASEERDRLQQLLDAVTPYQHTVLAELASADLASLRARVKVATVDQENAETARSDAAQRERELQAQRDARGGAALQLIDRDLADARAQAEGIAAAVERLRPVLERLGAPQPTGPEELAAAHALAEREQERIATVTAELAQGARPHYAALEDADQRRKTAEKEILSLRSRRSNLSADLVAVRDQLAEAAGEAPGSLPFVAELMDVRDPAWQGAVERLLGSLSVTILVPERLYARVSRSVEGRHWGQRIAYERVREAARRDTGGIPPGGERTVLSVLQLADSPFRDWLRARIGRSYPHVLVDDISDLHRHDRALTIAGQIKNRDHHVKDDRHRIEDRSRWIIGTDNSALLELRRQQLQEAQQDIGRAQAALAGLEKQRRALQERQQALGRLLETEWADLDLAGAQERTRALEARRTVLLADADLESLDRALAEATADHAEARSGHDDARLTLQTLKREAGQAQADLERARAELEGIDPDPELRQELDRRIRARRRAALDRAALPDAVLHLERGIREDLEARRETIRRAESALGTARGTYLRRWPDRSANLVDDIDATEDFLRILAQLETDRLPEFEHRFRDLLRSQSQNNIGQLRAVISQAIRDVHQRLAPVNRSLAATAFDTERRTWLTLVAQQKHTEEVRDFLTALLEITQGAFGQGEENIDQAEARYARMDALMRRLGSAEAADVSWRRRVLDTRRHVEFVARELDESGEVVDIYRGAGGRSGGQRQRLVTFCLAAALRYQLTDSADGDPPYGLVVLDEAFGNSDMHYTRAGLEVFRSFGFQMLLATPLKMLQTIEEYVGGAVVVAKGTDSRSSLAAVTFTAQDAR